MISAVLAPRFLGTFTLLSPVKTQNSRTKAIRDDPKFS